MGQLIQVRNQGIYSAPNELGDDVPSGAWLTGDNCVLRDNNIAEPRRGYQRDNTLPATTDRMNRFASFQSQRMGNWTAGKVGYDNAGTWTALTGTYSDPSANDDRLRFIQSQFNLYFTSSVGVYRLDTYNGTPVLAGVDKALDVESALAGDAAGFLSRDEQVAYRAVWGIRDANNTLHLGAVSGREVITHPDGHGASADNVDLTVTIPAGITTSHFIQIYRSKLSGGEAVTPSDELGLVYEANPTAGEITAGTMAIEDRTPDDLRGATLYTSPSQEGISQNNERPPLCRDIEIFKNCMFFSDIESFHRLIFTLLSADTTFGIQNDDTITIDGDVYTGKAAEDTSAGEFLIETGGTPAQNIADTAVSLVRVINRWATNTTVYAYYLSGPDDLPGQILVESRSMGGSSFDVSASVTPSTPVFNPPIALTTETSRNDNFQNAIMISKPFIHEAVPLLNIRRVGSENYRIKKIKKLRNSLFIMKEGENEGIFRLTGTDPSNFEVDEFDSSAELLAPDTVQVVNNQIWALTDQGVVTISESGVSVVSRPIEDKLLDAQGADLTAVKRYSWAMGYETERQYHLFTISASGETVATQSFVYNTFTKGYARGTKTASAGFVDPITDKIYLGEGDSYNIAKERKSRDRTDYVDHDISLTVLSVDEKELVLSSVGDAVVGDLITQSTSKSKITAIDTQTDTVTVASDFGWSTGAVTLSKAIAVVLEYTALTGGNPGMEKQYSECIYEFSEVKFTEAQAGFATDYSPSKETTPISLTSAGPWGQFPWGQRPWGGGSNAPVRGIRCEVPLEKTRGGLMRVSLDVTEAYGFFRLNGFVLNGRETGSTAVGA